MCVNIFNRKSIADLLLKRRLITIFIICICLGTLFTSLLHIKRVVEPRIKMVMEWNRRFPIESAVLPGFPEGTVKINPLKTYFKNALMEFDEYLVSFPIKKANISDGLLGDIISTAWNSHHKDEVSVDLMNYPPECELKKALRWDLNYSFKSDSFHKISHQFSTYEDWSNYTALIVWVKGEGDYDANLLFIGISSHDGQNSWYKVAKHIVQSLDGWTMLFLPLSAPDQSSFESFSVTKVQARYYVQNDITSSAKIWLSNFYLGKTDFILRTTSLKNEVLFELPTLTSEIKTQTNNNWTDLKFEIIPSQTKNLTENSYIVLMAKFLGIADFVKIGIEGLDTDGQQRSFEIIELPQSEKFSLKIIHLQNNLELNDIITINKIFVAYGLRPNQNVTLRTQFRMLDVVEDIPSIDETPLDSLDGEILTFNDVKLPHRFNWTIFEPLEIYVDSTIHQLNLTREVIFSNINSIGHIFYSKLYEANRIMLKVWFIQANEAPIILAQATVLQDQSEQLDLNYTQNYLSILISPKSEGVRVLIIFNYWPSPWMETALVSFIVLFVGSIFLAYNRVKSKLVDLLEKLTIKNVS